MFLRKDLCRLIAVALVIPATAALTNCAGALPPAASAVYQYSALAGSRRAYLYVPPRCAYVRGVIMALSNLTERDWLEDPIVRQAAAEECLAILWLGDGNNTPLNADLNPAGGAALDKLLEDLAQISGYHELALAPLIATGHSANGNFAWDAALLHPDRVIAAIPIKTYPLPETLRLAGVPMLYMVAETTEWPQYRDFSHPGDRDFFWPVVRDSAVALRSADPGNNLIGVVTDPGGGHFDWSDRDAAFLALYIRKACRYRLPPPPTDGSRVKLKPLDPHSGWLTDTGGMQPDHFPAAPYDKFLGDPQKAYWFFDEETARAAVAFEGERKQRAKQMLTFVQDGKPLPVASRGYAKLRFDPEPDGITFKLQGTFLTELPPELTHAGEPLGHADGPIQFKRITGPAVQIGPDTFRVHFDRGTLDGNRPKESTIWITEEHLGDSTYRHAVQPGQIVIPTMLTSGTPQQLVFPQIPNQKKATRTLTLHAMSTSRLPVAYYVVAGPATITGDQLTFTEIPIQSAYPVKVTIVAYQWGRISAPLYQSAQPIEQTFLLER